MSRCSQQSKAKYVVHNRVTDTYFCYEKAITWGIWRDKLCLVPELEEIQLLVIFKQDDVPPYWSNNVWTFLDQRFPDR
jgi:hypothetical protein